METRLVGAGTALFLVSYAQATPLFTLFGVKVNIALALAVLAAFSFNALREYALLAFAAACGLALGIGFFPALLFFVVIFATTHGVRRVFSWRPLLAGCALVIFFTLLTYFSTDFGLIARLAPRMAREALYNVAAFALLYALMPPRYARHGRY